MNSETIKKIVMGYESQLDNEAIDSAKAEWLRAQIMQAHWCIAQFATYSK